MSYTLGNTLYKLDSKGKVREWKIEVVDNGTHATIVTTAGLQDGKQVVNSIDIYEGKNVGKSNETTYYTQAVSEALATAELKLRGEYRTELDTTQHQTLRSGIKAPMLAQKYDATGKQSSSKTLEKMKLEGEKIHVQPKLDGNRCLIQITPNEDGQSATGVMHTRKGDVMPVQLKHILNEVLQNYYEIFSGDGGLHEPIEITLDGELFSTEMSFNELNGHLKRKDSKDPEQLAKIKFHLYDVMSEKPYSERYEMITSFASEHVELIPSYEIEANDGLINEFLERFLAEGHEGLMIRRLDMPYENKRSWQLCKVKVFEDAEYELVDIEEDARGGFVGAFVMKLSTPSINRDGKTVHTFNAGVRSLTHEEGAKMLANKQDYIGKTATIEYFGLSEYSIPRFPKLKAFRD